MFIPEELNGVSVHNYTQGGAICLLPTDPMGGVTCGYITAHIRTYFVMSDLKIVTLLP
jgi:hypothetical protein